MNHIMRYLFFTCAGFFLATIVFGLIDWLDHDNSPLLIMGGVLGAVISLPILASACSKESKEDKKNDN
jgi:uncharacterized membrane protein HdeD (DUF308 family)